MAWERERRKANEWQGSANAPLSAGHSLFIEDLSGELSGDYFVTSVQHLFQHDGGTCVSYANTFTAIPASVPYRPDEAAPRPRVGELQTAVVISDQDPEQMGRVKVRFPWAGASSSEAIWARVAFHRDATAPSAVPEVGDEVLVAFIDGDPRAPIVIGSLFNGVDTPPAP